MNIYMEYIQCKTRIDRSKYIRFIGNTLAQLILITDAVLLSFPEFICGRLTQ